MDRIYAAGVDSKSSMLLSLFLFFLIPVFLLTDFFSLVILGHYIMSNVILLVQTAILLSIAVFGFRIAIAGDIIWVIFMLLALGGVGMCLGLVISGAAIMGIYTHEGFTFFSFFDGKF